jgi:hypothetical protein
MKYLFITALIWAGLAFVGAAAEQRLSLGAELGILELHGLRDTWDVDADVARLLLGVAEFGPSSGLGARLSGGFGTLEEQSLSKFELAVLFNIPLHGARFYLSGGTGIVRFAERIYPLAFLSVGLKGDIFRFLTVYIDAQLLGVLQLSGEPLFPPGMPFQFSPGVLVHF